MCGNVPFCGFSAFGRSKFLTSWAAKKMKHLEKIWDEIHPKKNSKKFQASPSK